MKLLIIGGTGFLGRHLTSLALDWGHEVTLSIGVTASTLTGAELSPTAGGQGSEPGSLAGGGTALGSGHRHLLL